MRTSFIVDFKINKQGDVRIMEMGRALPSGYNGYKDITGKDMFWDNIAEDLKREGVLLWTIQPDILRPDHSLAKKRSLLGKDTDFGKSQLKSDFLAQAASMKNVIIWEGPHQLKKAKHVEDKYKQDIDIQIIDHSLVSALCFDSKACLHAFAGDVLEPILPAEDLYVFPQENDNFKRAAKNTAAQIKQDIGQKSKYVLKPAEAAQGNGIIISKYDDLEENLYNFFHNFYNDPQSGVNGMLNTGCKESERISNFFVAQELVSSLPISMYEAFSTLPPSNITTLFHRLSAFKKDKLEREPTIRMVISYLDGNLMNHGSYYKLSSEPVNTSSSHKSIISDAKFSAPVLKEMEVQYFSSMKPYLMKMFKKFEDTTLETMLENMQMSDNKSLNYLADDILHDKRTPHFISKTTLPTNSNQNTDSLSFN